MTVDELKAALSEACDVVDSWETSAGLTRYIVLSEYGAKTLIGSDAVRDEIPKVQLDICWQSDGDTLLSDVKEILTENQQTYTVADVAFEDELAVMRAILQLEVC